VRSVPAADEKPLHWLGSAKRDFLSFPATVKDNMGTRSASLNSAEPLGPGVLEILESHDGNAYRTLYTVRFAKAVYVIHAFQKSRRRASGRLSGTWIWSSND